jgi:hypothetical protein
MFWFGGTTTTNLIRLQTPQFCSRYRTHRTVVPCRENHRRRRPFTLILGKLRVQRGYQTGIQRELKDATWTSSLSLFTFTIYINPTNSHNKWTFHLRTKRCVCSSAQHLLVLLGCATGPSSPVAQRFSTATKEVSRGVSATKPETDRSATPTLVSSLLPHHSKKRSSWRLQDPTISQRYTFRLLHYCWYLRHASWLHLHHLIPSEFMPKRIHWPHTFLTLAHTLVVEIRLRITL